MSRRFPAQVGDAVTVAYDQITDRRKHFALYGHVPGSRVDCGGLGPRACAVEQFRTAAARGEL